jgi:hypothetical protein
MSNYTEEDVYEKMEYGITRPELDGLDDEGKQRFWCTPPPRQRYDAKDLPLEKQADMAYMYQHIRYNNESAAIEWLNKYHQFMVNYPRKNEPKSVLSDAVRYRMENLISRMLELNTVSQATLDETREEWSQFD